MRPFQHLPASRGRPFRVLASALLLLGLVRSHAQAAEASPLLFLGNQNIAPVLYVEEGKPVGVAADLVRAIAPHISRPIEIRAMDWKEAQAMVKRGEADALVQINRTEEREKIYDFSDPLLESQFSIFVRSDRVGIQGLSSLRGLRVGVESAGLPRLMLEKNPNIQLAIIPNFVDGFRMVNRDTIDAVIVDYRVGSYELARHSIRNIVAAGEPIGFSFSAIAVRKGNGELLSQINGALKTIKADGTYQHVLDKWKPTEAVFHTREQISQIVGIAVSVGVLTLLLVAGAWILTLKRELTRRRAAEAKLGEQYSTLRSIINDGDAIVFAVDRQFRYTAFNQAHAQVMKNLYDVTIELGCSMLDAMRVSADRDTARQNLEKALAGQKLVEEAYSGQDPSQRRYFRVSHSPIRTEGGAIIGVSALAQDLTLRKLAEEEVRDLNRELDRRVRERTAELNAANKELEAFAYSVSHDLRAPVRHIDGYIELLTRSLGATIDERSRGYLERVVDSTKRMGDLIDDLLSFSRMGRVELARLPVDLAKLTSDVIRACEPETRDRNIRWTIDALPAVVGDEAMLRIVLSNLVLNALKFSRPRAIATIEIGWKRDVTDETVIFVRDNGVGFDMKYVAKLFGVFQRLHRSEDFDGTGIGLANVQRIVRRHGGHAWAEGALDAGATFFFALPNTSHVPDRSSAVAAP